VAGANGFVQNGRIEWARLAAGGAALHGGFYPKSGYAPVRYTLGVLGRWKMAAVYCQAVLSHDQRIALDGAPAEAVDTEAKDLAAKQLAQLAARKAAKKAAEGAAPVVVKPKPASPTETPAQLRDRVRAALLRRRA